MSLRSALDRIVAIQLAVTITSPISLTVKRAYKLVPPANTQLPDLPAFFNEVTLVTMEASPSLRQRNYRIRMQCAAAKATVEDDRSADIALALFEKTLDDFGHDLSLANNVTLAYLRGADPTVGLITMGDMAYVGFEAFLDIRMDDAFVWS